MKSHKMPDMKEGNVNVTPLIDVVMCLIVFYMLVARIGLNNGASPMELPKSPYGAKFNDPMNIVNLNVEQIGNDCKIDVLDQENSTMRTFIGSNATQMRDLIQFLKQLRARNDALKTVVRARGTLDYRFIQPALLVISQAGVKEYAFEARKEETE
jgi:biopolymer transport protein ExbD